MLNLFFRRVKSLISEAPTFIILSDLKIYSKNEIKCFSSLNLFLFSGFVLNKKIFFFDEIYIRSILLPSVSSPII